MSVIGRIRIREDYRSRGSRQNSGGQIDAVDLSTTAVCSAFTDNDRVRSPYFTCIPVKHQSKEIYNRKILCA